MATVPLLSDDEVSPEALAVFNEIRELRQTDYVNNFWRALAHDPAQLRATWDRLKVVMAPGALDTKAKELQALAIGISQRCVDCIGFHVQGAAKHGATRDEIAETISVAVMMGGGPAYMYGVKALQAYDQLI